MMDRQTMIRILAGLDDQSLVKALAVNGVQVHELRDPDLMGLSHDAHLEKIPGWSALSIKRGPDNRPAMYDKNAYVRVAGQAPVAAELPADGGLDGYESWIPGGGM